jgi:hypothetical protein
MPMIGSAIVTIARARPRSRAAARATTRPTIAGTTAQSTKMTGIGHPSVTP